MTAKQRRTAMLIVLSVAYTTVFMQPVFLTVIAKDVMADLALTPPRVGMLGSAYLYSYAVMMILSGAVAAVIGPRLTLTLTFCASGAGSLLFGLSSSLAGAILGRALCGFGLAATMTASFTIFGRWYHGNAFSRVSSIFVAVGGTGVFIGTLGATYINSGWGWRASSLVFGALTLLFAVFLFAIVRDWPSPQQEPPPGLAKVEERGKASVRLLAQCVKQVSHSADFWRLVAWMGTNAGVYFTFFGLWAVPYLKDVYGLSDAEAGAMASLAGLGYIVASPIVTWLCDTVFHSYRIALGLSGLLTVIVSAAIVLRPDGFGKASLTLLILLFGLVLNASNVVAYASARNIFGSWKAGIVNGAFGGAGFVCGALLQVFSGWLLFRAETAGREPGASYAAAFTPFLVFGLVTAVAGFTLSRRSFGGDGE